jgi:soluble lytic murein transglycosylase
MQVMPATARQVARELGLPRPSVRSLINPDTNIALGTGYLRMMLDELQQDEVLATAAYNAGPHRVNRWLNDPGMPPDIWVELIPFRETRGYVQRVLAYAAIYDRRLGSKQARVSDRLNAARARG